MNIGKLLNEETPVRDHTFDRIIQPANQIIQKVLKEAALHNQEVLSELLTVDPSDLIKVFRHIFFKTDDIEEAYRQILKGVEQLGAKTFIEQFSDIEVNESDSMEKGYLQKLDKIIKSMKSNPEVFSNMDNSKIHHLVKEYLTQVNYIDPSRIPDYPIIDFIIRLNPVLHHQRRKI